MTTTAISCCGVVGSLQSLWHSLAIGLTFLDFFERICANYRVLGACDVLLTSKMRRLLLVLDALLVAAPIAVEPLYRYNVLSTVCLAVCFSREITIVYLFSVS
jgi:hypothetical protein